MLLCCVLLFQKTVLQDKLPIETNILKLLPNDEQDKVAIKAYQQLAEQLNNRVIFVIKGEDKDNLVDAAISFKDQVSTLALFSQFESSIDPQQQQAWSQFYFPYRAQLLTAADKQQLLNAPDTRITDVIQQLYNPFSGVSGKELSADPFLLFRSYLSAFNPSKQNFSLYNNHLFAEVDGENYLVIQASLKGDAYDMQLQQLYPALAQIEQQVQVQFHVKLLHTGSYFYAVYGTDSAKQEVSTIGVGSLIGVILLFLLVYRSALPIVLAMFSIGCGLLVALLVTLLVFGQVHLFSLVFGASLIGVSIDYAFHFLTERLAAHNRWNANSALKHIFNAITLGLITSLIGYLGLLVAPFPGLQQLSLFSIVGLLSAYLTVVLCYPSLAKSASERTPPPLVLLQRWLHCWQNPKLRFVLPCLFAVLGLLGLTQLHFDDDIHQLQAMPSDLKEQEQAIKEVMGMGNTQQLVLLRAPSEQQLLHRLEQVTEQFHDWQAQEIIGSVQSISDSVPSLQTQKANYQLMKQLYQEQGPVLTEQLGLKQVISLTQPFKPLTVNAYLDSPVSANLDFLWLGEVDGSYASIIMLADINNPVEHPNLVQDYINQQADIRVLDKAGEISSLFSHYRIFITEMLIAAYLLILLLLIWRYRIKLAIKVVIPPLIAGLVALSVTVLLAIPITIFNLLALLLVLGIGIDYTLFFAEKDKQVSGKNTFLAITLSAITTVLSFGLLALSETQAIHGFGITVLTGIITAWLLAPFAMSVHRDNKNG